MKIYILLIGLTGGEIKAYANLKKLVEDCKGLKYNTVSKHIRSKGVYSDDLHKIILRTLIRSKRK